MNTLIVGASGLLGKVLYDTLGCDGTHYKNKYKNTIPFEECDLSKYNVIINCVAEKDVDVAEKSFEKTYEVNTRFIDKLLQTRAHIIHISTDYVFDGIKDYYTTESKPNPLQIYGITKLLAECKVQTHPLWTILRIPVLYSDDHDIVSSFTDLTKKSIQVDSVSKRYHTSCFDVAEVVKHIIEHKIYGIQHFSSQKCRTKLDIVKELNLPIEIIETGCGNRPRHCHLVHDFQDKMKHTLRLGSFRIPLISRDVFLVLDFDGTLLDTVEIHKKCYEDTTTKDEKNENFKTYKDFKYIWNSEYMIDYIIENDINHIVLTNTTSVTINHIKECVPKFQKLRFVTKDDYEHRKPHPEPYERAMKYYNGEKHIMYFDDVAENLQPMEKYTDLIFHMASKQVQKRFYTLNDLKVLKYKI